MKIKRCCYIKCHATNHGGALYLNVNSSFASKNSILNCSSSTMIGAEINSNYCELNDFSISKCYTLSSNLEYGIPLRLRGDYGKLEYHNSSFNDCNHIGTLCNLKSVEHNIKYISAYNDKASYSVLFQAQSCQSCKISIVTVANCSVGEKYGIFRSCVGSNLIVENCVLTNNTSKYEFFSGESQDSLIISNYCCDKFRCFGNVQNFSANQCIDNFALLNLEFLCYRVQSIPVDGIFSCIFEGLIMFCTVIVHI